jgi:hypothetical protein
MKLNMTVRYEGGGTDDVSTKARDTIRLERHYQTTISKVIEGGWSTEQMWYMAYAALCRTGRCSLEFDQWIDTVDEVEVVTEPAVPSEAVPTPSP